MRFFHKHSILASYIIIFCTVAFVCNIAAVRLEARELSTFDESWEKAWPADFVVTVHADSGRVAWSGQYADRVQLVADGVDAPVKHVRLETRDPPAQYAGGSDVVITPTALVVPELEPIPHADNVPLFLAAAAYCDLDDASRLHALLETSAEWALTLAGMATLAWPVTLYVVALSLLLALMAGAPFRAALAAMSHALPPVAVVAALLPLPLNVVGPVAAALHLLASIVVLSAWVFPRASLDFVDEPPSLWAAACEFVMRQGVWEAFGAAMLQVLVNHSLMLHFGLGPWFVMTAGGHETLLHRALIHVSHEFSTACFFFLVLACTCHHVQLHRVFIAYALAEALLQPLDWLAVAFPALAHPSLIVALHGLQFYLFWAWAQLPSWGDFVRAPVVVATTTTVVMVDSSSDDEGEEQPLRRRRGRRDD